jgi:hypothetical protein
MTEEKKIEKKIEKMHAMMLRRKIKLKPIYFN